MAQSGNYSHVTQRANLSRWRAGVDAIKGHMSHRQGGREAFHCQSTHNTTRSTIINPYPILKQNVDSSYSQFVLNIFLSHSTPIYHTLTPQHGWSKLPTHHPHRFFRIFFFYLTDTLPTLPTLPTLSTLSQSPQRTDRYHLLLHLRTYRCIGRIRYSRCEINRC
jgi:hypothetical protein